MKSSCTVSVGHLPHSAVVCAYFFVGLSWQEN